MKVRNRWFLVPIGTFALIAILGESPRERCLSEAAKEQAQHYGNFTRWQILHRAVNLYGLDYTAGPIVFTAERIACRNAEGQLERFWMVDGNDEKGNFVVTEQWSAATGNLLYFSQKVHTMLSSNTALGPDEMVARARCWLRIPGIGLADEQWRLYDASALLSRNSWNAIFVSQTRAAYIKVDRPIGALVVLRFTRLPTEPHPLTAP